MTAPPSEEIRKSLSPLETYLSYCRRGHLAYQVTEDGEAVFFPRVIAPQSGRPLAWRVSEGTGTVYATTVVYRRDEEPLNVALIDLDEGFRMMSRVEGVDPTAVRIGDRVRVKIQEGDDSEPPLPLFVPMGDENA